MPNILFIDIETSANLAYVWEMWQQDVIAFEKEREIICVAYKWEGSAVKVFARDRFKPKEIAKKLRDLLDKADVAVAHNGDHFDFKMINTAIIKQGLKPPSPYKTIDTKKLAYSKFRFNSNKLDNLGQYLGLGKKIDTGGFKLWLACLRKDKKAWRKMKGYNKQDVVLLEKVYNKLRGWSNTTPIQREGFVCAVCGSNHFNRHGWKFNKKFKVRRMQCQSCGHWTEGERLKHDKIYLK